MAILRQVVRGSELPRSPLVHWDALMLAVQGSNRQSQVTVQEVFALASSTAVLRPSNPTRFAQRLHVKRMTIWNLIPEAWL
jgi:hypothetical protein